ncbi:MAG: tRNA (guanosine(37)-N1)-methyltransferase TrmD [Chloroflexota bacterium]
MEARHATSDSANASPRLTVDIVTLFPQLFESWLTQGVVSRAMARGVAAVRLWDLRPYGVGRHKVTDDYPFGGGAGMVMKPEPLFAAMEDMHPPPEIPVILLSPGGRTFDQSAAVDLAQRGRFVLIAGHYEGVDERVRRHLVSEELSIGDFVLSAGELAAMVVTDAAVRLVPGALAEASTIEESFTEGLLEYPQYTRPARFRSWRVPDTLLSGHHEEIRKWRRLEALHRTYRLRRDLLESAKLDDAERALIATWKDQERETSGDVADG